MRTEIREDLQIERKVEALLAKMTLKEKIGQMTQVRHFDDIDDEDVARKHIGSIIHTQGPTPGHNAAEWQARFRELQEIALSTRMGIPLLFGVDAIHGQNTYEGATIFPHNIGLGATGNARLVEKAAAITAKEAQATGFNWVFSPCVAIPYNEKWGRVYEAFSESTALTTKLTRASVTGHQGILSDKGTVMATVKHFIGDGSTEYGVEGGETSLTPKHVEERLLPPYEEAVKSGVGSVMTSFNTLDGIPMHANKAMITDLLKQTLKFDGIVVSDWKGYSKYGQNDIINAGVDMVMAVDGDLQEFHQVLNQGISSGEVPMERIDDAVRRILRQKFRLGLFENPFPDSDLIASIGCDSHREVARQAVRESLVLLKNKANLLPLDKKIKRIVVVGEHADNSGLQSGGWTINWQGSTENYQGASTIIDGIREAAYGEVVYDVAGVDKHPDADVAIICVGEKPYAEFFGDVGHEESDCQLTLTREHKNYISHYVAQGIPTVVVLMSGRPLVVTEELEMADAFIAAWLPGSEGRGVADVLFGDYNFTGKLPHSWPESEVDYENKYGPNFWQKKPEPLFPIGFGLEYQKS
ncbi:glycoside hydrolase family 3 protein [Lentiprolixibacter aurantiacus]|uniref:beta-glucosidase n=1 Tax=Lentiprolixibacter aurantiacus TaxID=2993939 RepID=A0AAE3MMY1_9FLAO|nr:glycoside hydrolase family 3 N-terminal domain-containing protein [Lentiprolixibacter aurantiacus]MCX2719829.1 glycoside hydrolase family 3 C-terminal domain-containing protein [Lentiprolixibacter aurantiacus]